VEPTIFKPRLKFKPPLKFLKLGHWFLYFIAENLDGAKKINDYLLQYLNDLCGIKLIILNDLSRKYCNSESLLALYTFFGMTVLFNNFLLTDTTELRQWNIFLRKPILFHFS